MNLVSVEEALEQFDPVIGLEVHVELNTQTKMFSPAPNPAASLEDYAPNTAISPVCLGLPGSLPVVNHDAVRSSIALGLALGCEIAPSSRFARKNYFYPDLAKNYQISQYDEPIAHDGQVEVELDDQTLWTVAIERAHMEEDAGKLTHVGGQDRPYSRRRVFPRRLQPCRGAPGRDSDQTDCGLRRKSPTTCSRVCPNNSRHCSEPWASSQARMERGNLRCERQCLAYAQRLRHPRHPVGDEKRELVPVYRTGGDLRNSTASHAAARWKSHCPRNEALARRHWKDKPWAPQIRRRRLPLFPRAGPPARDPGSGVGGEYSCESSGGYCDQETPSTGGLAARRH